MLYIALLSVNIRDAIHEGIRIGLTSATDLRMARVPSAVAETKVSS